MALLALLPYGRIPWGLGFPAQHDIGMSDLLHAHLPYREFLGERLSHLALPIWWPQAFSGTPLLPQIEAGVFYLPQWPFYALLDPYLAFCWVTGTTLVIGAFGMSRWVRAMGGGVVAGAFAAVAFAGCGFNISHVKHPNFLYAAAWLPWVLYALETALDAKASRRFAFPMLAAVLAIEASAGMPQVIWMLALVIVARVLVEWIGRVRHGEVLAGSRFLLPAAAAGLVGAGMMAVQFLPTVAFTGESIRPMEMTRAYSTQYDSRLEGLLTFVFPDAAGQPFWAIGADCIQWEVYAFCGLSTLLLGVLGAVASAKNRARWFWLGAAFIALLLSFGGHGPLFDVAWDFVPGIRMFRFHQRWMLFVQLVLCVFAGLGLELILGRVGERVRPRLGAAALLLVTTELTLANAPHLPVDPIDHWRRPSAAERLFAQSGERVLMADSFAPWFDTHIVNRGFGLHGTAPFTRMARWPIGSMPSILGYSSPSGYVNLVEKHVGGIWMYDVHFPRDPATLLPQWRDAPLPEQYPIPRPAPLPDRIRPRFAALLSRASVRTFVADHAARAEEVGFESIGQAGGLFVYRNPGALPRAYLASQWIPVRDYRHAVSALHAQPPIAPRIPILETDARPRTTGSDSILPVTVREPTPERIELSVESTGAWLVLTDSMAKGWSASIDAASTEIVRANGWQRAVFVPPGSHEVVFQYRCPGLREGALISAACLLAWIAWVVAVARRNGVNID